MKKIKILSLVFALVFAVAPLAGCNDESDSGSSSSFSDEPVKEMVKTGYKLVDKGTSEYTVVIPATPTQNEYMAASEFEYFMELATPADITIVNEDKFNITDTSSVISIGNTAYADQKGIKTDGSLDVSGYVMKTVGNQLFIRSDGDGQGCVYAVYDLLETSIGYRYYYTDEIYYEETDSVELYEYDEVVKPSFDFRAMSTWNAFLHTHEDYMRRTRTFRRDQDWAKTGEMHQQTRSKGVVPADEWLELHKFGTKKLVEGENGEMIEVDDYWFSETGTQLCWTAGEDLYQQAAKDIISMIESEPTKKYFPVGQADVTLFCDCDRCTQAKQEWALNDAGLQMHFINRVAHYVNEWTAVNCPEREIRLVVFAYYATETPPVVQDANGKWVPWNDKVDLAADNIDIYFAPIYTDYSKMLTDVENKDVYSNLTKWYDFLQGKPNRFMLWTYDTNFHYFFYNFNNFDTFTEQAKVYGKYGVDYFHSQGANGTNQPCFQEMRYFVESQILWDTSKNYDELVDEFMLHFYKDASEEIREYYDFIRMRYEQATVLDGTGFTSIYADIGSKKIWTEGVVDVIDNMFERAYQKIEHYKVSDPDMYEKLFNRIKELELTQIYTKLKNYSNNYTPTQLSMMVDEFNYYTLKFDINRVKEGGDFTAGLFDSLKK